MLSVFPAHASQDAEFAHDLGRFLESGCNAVCFPQDGVVLGGEDLLSTAERGLSADILVLLLSQASNLPRWSRERWEPLLFGRAPEENTRVAIFLLEECSFPAVMRRGLRFFDATTSRLPAMRRLKRWLWGMQFGAEPGMSISTDLEILYQSLADQPGTYTATGAMASRFAHEAARDFEAVFWIPAHGRSLARIAGELGFQLRMPLDGPVEENCARIRAVLSGKRCLLILDAPQVPIEQLLPAGRSSVLFTSDPVRVVADAPSVAAARDLAVAGRFAEAYEVFYQLLNSGIGSESCARELIWICEHWGRLDEANALRFRIGPSPSEQLMLF